MRIFEKAVLPVCHALSLSLLIACAQPGCQPLLPKHQPEVQLGERKIHFAEGDPAVAIMPLVNRKNEILGAIVQVGTYQAALNEMELANETESQQANAASARLRARTLVDSTGVILVADGKWKKLDKEEIAGGPWIYYLNEDEPFTRIPVDETSIEGFKSALVELHPLEFVTQWCEQQVGERLAVRFALKH